ncbi:uncharacterized protein LOC143043791 [Mytilus galloprovincialis]|uniref:uncharacterized protein LOC143043791 n=1 Tax=Mytilus galloprovincialis TaxID=29158 RepID=UPI003F7CA8EE
MSENIPTEESNDPKETIDQVPVLIHTDTCPSPDPYDNGPGSYIPMNVDPCPIDLHNDNSDGIRTTHTEVEMVNTSTTQKEADNQTPKVATKKKYRSARIQVHPKTKEKCIQADFQPRLRSFGIQCNLLSTPIEPQQDNNTEERHQEHNGSGHMEHEDPVVPDDTNDPVIPDDINDPSYEPSINDSSDSGGSDNSHNELETHLQEKKFIVCEDQLMDLFKICPKCCGSANASIAHTVGTLIKVNVTCELCQHSYSWYSQPFLGSVPAGNLAVSSAILYSGALPTKVLCAMPIYRYLQIVGPLMCIKLNKNNMLYGFN